MEFKRSLGLRRVDRLTSGEDKNRPSIASISAKFSSEEGLKQLEEEAKETQREVDEWIKETEKRIANEKTRKPYAPCENQ